MIRFYDKGERQTDRQTDRHNIYREKQRQANRKTDRQKQRQRDVTKSTKEPFSSERIIHYYIPLLPFPLSA